MTKAQPSKTAFDAKVEIGGSDLLMPGRSSAAPACRSLISLPDIHLNLPDRATNLLSFIQRALGFRNGDCWLVSNRSGPRKSKMPSIAKVLRSLGDLNRSDPGVVTMQSPQAAVQTALDFVGFPARAPATPAAKAHAALPGQTATSTGFTDPSKSPLAKIQRRAFSDKS